MHTLDSSHLLGILDIADDAIICIDAAQHIVLFNHGAQVMFGYAPAAALGEPLSILIPDGLHAAHVAHVADFARAPVTARRMGQRQPIRGRRQDGSTFPAEASISRLEQDGRTIFTAIVRDISTQVAQQQALEAARDEAEQAAAAKSMFLANMSHEIRTPLNAVVGMTSLLLATEISDEQRDYTETIRASSEALLNLINDILDYSKIDIGKLEMERQPFDLRRCVEDALDLLSPQAAEKNLNLAYFIDDSVPATLVSDVTRIRQILVNLVGNATKFTSRGEVIVSVTARPADAGRLEIEFAVRDTGIGIPADKQPDIFQSFRQVDASTTRRFGGTGLGLAISRRLAEILGGRMWLESAPGVGSTFSFTVMAEAGSSALAQNLLQDRAGALTGRRVLIVDDNTTNRRILVKQALLWGMLPSAVASAVEALDLIRHGHAFDLGIVDMSMPDMDGVGLALEIRKYRDPATLPLIMLTSVAYRPKSTLVERAGFDAYLNKPIKPVALFDAITHALRLERGQAHRGLRRRERNADRERLADVLPLRILVAEDNAVNQRVLQKLLDHLGYRIDVVANGREVLDAVERQNYDLILMDVQMPEMDGMEATRRLRARFGRGHGPRIVAMTANALPGDREACLAAGMDAYLAKPIEVDHLRAVLAQQATPTRDTDANDATVPVLDDQRLQQLYDLQDDDNPRLVAQIVDLFVSDSPQHLAALRDAAATADAAQLKAVAHRFLSSIENLGALRMRAPCRDLEALGKAGSTDGAAARIEALANEFVVVKAALADRVHGTG